jgi:hypothetical protein
MVMACPNGLKSVGPTIACLGRSLFLQKANRRTVIAITQLTRVTHCNYFDIFARRKMTRGTAL